MKERKDIILNPIKEIIFGISFADNISIERLNEFISVQKIKEAFPVIRPGYNADLKVSNEGNPPTTNVQKAGYILKCDEPSNKILQAKLGLFAFHKTKEYENYQNLVSELNDYWITFQQYTGTLKVTNVSLRYLNFIDIDENEDNSDYLTIITKSPFKTIINEFTQLKLKTEQDPNTEATIVATKGKDSGRDGVILDIILNRKVSSCTFEYIDKAFEGMREIKNSIFQKAITDKTRRKYSV